MDFARKQLLKYGWKEGEGLGKEGNQGITTAIKPKYKLGREGMGFDLTKELVDTWWTKSYEDCLARINISSSTNFGNDESDDDGVHVSFKQDNTSDGSEITKIRKRTWKSNFQEFSKGATLDNGMMVDENENDEDSDADSGISTPTQTSSKNLTDEELFKACGGRTGHKAARFGHKLSGKLARLAAQEEAETAAIFGTCTNELSSFTSTKTKKPKRKYSEAVPDLHSTVLNRYPSSGEQKKKKKKKYLEIDFTEKTDEFIQPDEFSPMELCDDNEVTEQKKSRKKKKKN